MKFGAIPFSLLHRRRHSRLFLSLLFSSNASPQLYSSHKHQPLPKNSQSYPQNITHNLNFITYFLSLAETLTQNPRNLKGIAHLDSVLTHVQSFDSVTSVAAIDALCRLRKLNRAKTVLLHLKDSLKVSPYFAYSLVFDCLVKDGKLDDVEIQWGEIFGDSKVNLSDFVIYVCKWGDLEEIKSVCERVLMDTRVLGRQSYLALIGALCRYNEGLMAKSVLHQMYTKGFRVDDISYIVMFQCFCRIGDLNEADWVLRKMVKSGYCIDVCIYESFMHALCKAGKLKEANKLFNKLMKRDCPKDSKLKFLKGGRRAIFQLKCEGMIPEMMAYEMYFRSLCNARKLDDAEILLKKVMKKSFMPQVCVYGYFIKALFRVDREEDALKFINVERKKGFIHAGELTRFLIIEQCEMGRIDEAMRNFNEFVTKNSLCLCFDLCNHVLSALWSSGRAMEAERVFEQMKNGSLAHPSLYTYRIMISGFCDKGNLTKTLQFFEEMLSRKMAIEKNICETVVTLLLRHESLEEAYKLLNNMTGKGYMVSYTVWKKLFVCLIGQVEQQCFVQQ